MDTMQFRDFLFPHNPAKITMRGGARLAVHACPGVGEVVQDLGSVGRTVRCEGSFWGTGYGQAVAQMAAFRRRAGEGGGVLLIPGMEPLFAHLKELAFQAEGDGRVLHYAMVFQEGTSL